MSKPYDEQPDLNLVAKYFLARSLCVDRFSDTEKAGKTPEFRMRHDGLLVAYCEVKAPDDPWLDEQLDDAPPLTVVGVCRPDPTFNLLARLSGSGSIRAETYSKLVGSAYKLSVFNTR